MGTSGTLALANINARTNREIEDYEDNIINFKCNNIEITSVSNAKKINIQDL